MHPSSPTYLPIVSVETSRLRLRSSRSASGSVASMKSSFLLTASLTLLVACGGGETTPPAAGAPERVAPSQDGRTENDCEMSNGDDGEPVSAEEAEVLGVESVGGELSNVETTSDTREVCEES